MEKTLSKSEVLLLQMADTLELIARCDAMIEQMLSVGMKVDSVLVKQELLLKHRYCEELTQIFHSFNAKIQAIEEEYPLPKAA
jgi:hypothetical protein